MKETEKRRREEGRKERNRSKKSTTTTKKNECQRKNIREKNLYLQSKKFQNTTKNEKKK